MKNKLNLIITEEKIVLKNCEKLKKGEMKIIKKKKKRNDTTN